jgi:molybdenum cofactor cytidylyltransferase
MGKPKQFMLLQGMPMLERVLGTLRRTKVDLTVVVLGANAEEILRKVKMDREKVVVNSDYGKGMSESLKKGLASLQQEVDAALVVLGDQPFVSSATIDKIIEAYLKSRALVVLPVYHGRRGNPVLFDRRLFSRIMRINGDVGAKAVVEENEHELMIVEVEDEGVLLDLDTPQEFTRANSEMS